MRELQTAKAASIPILVVIDQDHYQMVNNIVFGHIVLCFAVHHRDPSLTNIRLSGIISFSPSSAS